MGDLYEQPTVSHNQRQEKFEREFWPDFERWMFIVPSTSVQVFIISRNTIFLLLLFTSLIVIEKTEIVRLNEYIA